MSATLSFERVESDILAALRVVDEVTQLPLDVGVLLSAPALQLFRKNNFDIIVTAAAGLGAAALDVPVDILPLGGGLLPRRWVLSLPRDADPANAALQGSIFQPALIPLLPAPAYPATGSLALLRVTVRRSTDAARIGSALVRLRTTPPSTPNARSMTDPTGEALLVVPGVPLTSAGPGATVVGDIGAELDVLVDPLLASFTADADLDTVRAAALGQTTGFVDPDDLEARLGGAPPPAVAVRVAAGRTDFASFTWVPA